MATAYDFILVQNFHLQMEAWGKNDIFGADMTSSVHIDNKNKDISILGEGPTKRLDDTTLIAATKQPILFTQPKNRFL